MRLLRIRIEMKRSIINQSNSRLERGQTLVLVALSLLSLLAIAALAIDLTTLYVARGEVQRAADAAALAGAKAFVDSGVTTDPSNTSLQNMAQIMATDYATAVASQNKVSGAPAQFAGGSPNVSFTVPGNANAVGNPRITVTLQRTDLPIFFARIWGNTLASVSATAIAEAYNPSFSQSNTGSFVPAGPKCVKPFLVPNNDPIQSGNPVFVDPASGAVNVSASSFIGEQITLSSACTPGGGQSGCVLKTRGKGPPGPTPGEYLPMLAPNLHQYCPSSSALACSAGTSDFEKSIQCCDGNAFDFQQCGVSNTAAMWDATLNPGGGNGPTQNGLQCLIHTVTVGPPNGATQQDTLDPSNFLTNTGPMQIFPGSFSQSRYNISANTPVATSDSITTVPLFDNSTFNPSNSQVKIVGFLQLFVNYVGPGGGLSPGDVNAYILNVSGCGSTAGSAVASGGGVSAIPVRLIHN
jgi:hypothetical protein